MRRSSIAWVAGAVAVVGMLASLLATRTSARTNPLVATIPTASFPSLTLAPGNRAIIVDQMGRRARLVDTTAGRIVGTLATGRPSPGHWLPIVVDGRLRRAFVAWPAAPSGPGAALTVAAFDLTDGRRVGALTISLPPGSFGGGDTYLAVDARRHRLFALPFGYPVSALLTVDTVRLRVLRTVALNPWQAGEGPDFLVQGVPLATDEGTGRVFVGRADEPAVAVLDAASGRLLRTVALPALPLAAGAVAGAGAQVACPVVAPDLARVYITNPVANIVTTLDARTGRIIRTVHLAFSPASPLVDVAGGRVVVPYQSRGGFAVLDARSGCLLRTRGFGPTPAITPVALDEGAQRAFVADYMGGTVAMVDLRTGRTLRTVGVGIHPSGLAFDRRHGRVLVTDAGPCCTGGRHTGAGALVVLDGASGRVVRTIPLGRGPLQPLTDEANGRALLVNTEGGTTTDLDPWRWVPRPIRQRLAVLPRPRTRPLSASVMLFDLAQLAQG